jgi:hypothetical protein
MLTLTSFFLSNFVLDIIVEPLEYFLPYIIATEKVIMNSLIVHKSQVNLSEGVALFGTVS